MLAVGRPLSTLTSRFNVGVGFRWLGTTLPDLGFEYVSFVICSLQFVDTRTAVNPRAPSVAQVNRRARYSHRNLDARYIRNDFNSMSRAEW